jgi:cytochrome c peroxidase
VRFTRHALTVLSLLTATAAACAGSLSPMEEFGKAIFFDTTLSEPPGQSCATCHGPVAGWTGPDSAVNATTVVYPGAIAARFGNRKPPSAAYATAPPLHIDPEEKIFVGGSFWDGRATGWLLGSPLADQAQGPFLNAVEQNHPDAEAVVAKVCAGPSGARLRELFGAAVCDEVVRGYNAVAQAIATYETSTEVNPFSSKYDHHLRDPTRYPLTAQERRGLALFERDDKGKCAACHPSRPGPLGEPPLFTDFTYDNLGIPRNPDNPWYRMPTAINPQGEAWIDEGLGGFLKTVPRYADLAPFNRGKHKVPTLRNVDLRPSADFVKVYGHNGYFRSLEAIVHFYNTRDALPRCEGMASPQPGVNCWPAPEVDLNVNAEEMGKLGLTPDEERDIVAFMRTLSDGWQPPVPTPRRP